VLAAWATNCCVADPGLATIQIMTNHARKASSLRSGATYHLVVSFAAGEKPEAAVLQTVERRLLEAVGLDHHPRITVQHADTEHTHLHILVSRVDPISDRVMAPRFDHRRLMQMAHLLEDKLGLRRAYHGEYRGRDPVMPGPRLEQHNPFVGDVDPELGARVHARFARAEAERISERREALANLRLETSRHKAALEADVAGGIQVLKQASARDPAGTKIAIARLRMDGASRKRAVAEAAAAKTRSIRDASQPVSWTKWLEQQASAGDQDARELTRQLAGRSARRHGADEHLVPEVTPDIPVTMPARTTFIAADRPVPSGQCVTGRASAMAVAAAEEPNLDGRNNAHGTSLANERD